MNSITRQVAAVGVIAIAAVCQPAFACDGVIDMGASGHTAMEPRRAASGSGDGLGVYEEDLSAYHVPIRRKPVAVRENRAQGSAAPVPGALPDPALLRALFHRPELNRLDGLAAYHDDPSWRPQIPMVPGDTLASGSDER